MNKHILFEKRFKRIEEALENLENISEKDNKLHNELVDDLINFIRQCTVKFNDGLGNADADKTLKKTKSFKLIKSLKEDWVNSAKK